MAVLVNPTLNEAIEIAKLPFIDALQLHGGESPGFCQMLAERGIHFAKAIPIRSDDALIEVADFFTDTVLLDSISQRGFGGIGEILPWSTGRRFIENHPALKVILAGGLNAANVAEAIRAVKPWGVDASSGLESSPGIKERKFNLSENTKQFHIPNEQCLIRENWPLT